MIEILELGIKSWAEILTSADDHNKTAPLDLTWTGIKVGERESDPELMDVYFNMETIFNTIITNLFTWSYQKTIIFYFD